MRPRLVLLVLAVLATACNAGTTSTSTTSTTQADSTTELTSPSTSTNPSTSPTSSTFPTTSTSTTSVPDGSDDPGTTSTTSDDSDTDDPPDVVVDDMEALLVPARQDAADRTGTEIGEVRVVDMEIREWPDSSLGCPQDEETYTDAPTVGIRLVVEAAGSTLDYRINFEGSFWLCE